MLERMKAATTDIKIMANVGFSILYDMDDKSSILMF